MQTRSILAAAVAALALGAPAADAAPVTKTQALSTTRDYMRLSCADGFDWACVDPLYLAPRCVVSAGHAAFYCTGVVREGEPNRFTVVKVRVRRRDGDVLIRTYPTAKLGPAIVQ